MGGIGAKENELGSRGYRSPWIAALPPDAIAIQSLAVKSHSELPEPLRSQTADVEIDVADFPTEDLADSLGLDTPFDLLGLFEGPGKAKYWTPRTEQKTPRLTLFRRAILDYWAENTEPLGDIIAHIVVNELGHHYGLGDDELQEIRAQFN